MAASYATAVQIRAYSRDGYAPTHKFVVTPYTNNSADSAGTQTFYTLDEAEDYYQQVLDGIILKKNKYDQVQMTQANVVVPS